MRRVLIGTPVQDGRVDVRYVDSLVNTLRMAPKDVVVDFQFIAHDALIQRARNDLLVTAMHAVTEDGLDDFLMIDADQTWDPQWFYALLEHKVDVVGLPVPKKSDKEQYNVKCTSFKPEIRQGGLMQVDGVGTGFLRLTKKAVQHVWDNSLKYVENGIEKRMAFNVEVVNGELYGEDIAFCKTLAPLGVWLDTRFTVPHIGHKVYTGNFSAWLPEVLKAIRDAKKETAVKA